MEGRRFPALWRTAGYRTAAPPGPRIPPVLPWAGRSPPRQISAVRGPSPQPPGCHRAACGTLSSHPRADTRQSLARMQLHSLLSGPAGIHTAQWGARHRTPSGKATCNSWTGRISPASATPAGWSDPRAAPPAPPIPGGAGHIPAGASPPLPAKSSYSSSAGIILPRPGSTPAPAGTTGSPSQTSVPQGELPH